MRIGPFLPLALLLAAPSTTPAEDREFDEIVDEQSRPDVIRAVFQGGRLWFLYEAGALSSLRESDRRASPEPVDGPVLDICKHGEGLIALGGALNSGSHWTVRVRQASGWATRARIERKADKSIGLACDAGPITILTSKRVVELGHIVTDRPLSEELPPALVKAAFLSTENAVYVGYDLGEWGGGLRRVDRATGRLAVIERSPAGEICTGPLNTACDPVQGIAPSPAKPGCIVAAIGLIHFIPRGRLVEVCAGRVERLFFKPVDMGLPNNAPDSTGEPGSTVAFFGLVRTRAGLVAAGHDGLYRMRTRTDWTFEPYPKFERRGALQVSLADPDVALVLTQVNRRASISGSTPILVAR